MRFASDSKNGTRPIAEYGTAALGDDSYTKGAWALFVLNELVGDDTFNKIVRTFLATYANEPADLDDFQAIAVSVSKREATRASSGVGPLRDFHVALLEKGIKPEMARLTLARKIATVA